MIYYLNVIDDKTVDIETFEVSVWLGIPEELQQEFGRLLRPSSLCGAELLSLSTATDSTVEPAEWNALFLVNYVL